MNIFETLVEYFSYPFVRYAIIVGILISLCASLLGVTLVLKRFSYLSDGLSHIAFFATVFASVLNLTNNTPVVFIITIFSAIFLLRSKATAKIKGDAAIAMLSVGALAVGYLLMNVTNTSSNIAGDVCTTLFGSTSILTLSKADVYLCLVVAIVVIAIFILFYHRIFAITFDETFATATTPKARHYNTLIAIITAIVIVLAMNLVGSLLISALIIFPAVTAMHLFKSFRSVIICSTVFSTICAFSGILISLLASTPVGATIVVVDIIVFLCISLISSSLSH